MSEVREPIHDHLIRDVISVSHHLLVCRGLNESGVVPHILVPWHLGRLRNGLVTGDVGCAISLCLVGGAGQVRCILVLQFLLLLQVAGVTFCGGPIGVQVLLRQVCVVLIFYDGPLDQVLIGDVG